MSHILWSQDFFAKGELSPLVYSRVTLDPYYQGLKRAKNVICFPQGSASKRFGTRFLNEITDTSDSAEVFFKSFQYLNECVYILAFVPDKIRIYLEGQLIVTVLGTGILGADIILIDSTILENKFRITTGIFPPKDLIRTADPANAITGFSAANDTLTITNALNVNSFFPARFTTPGALPTTIPRVVENKTYFIRAITANTIRIYNTAPEAAANENFFEVTAAGAANLIILNVWTLSNVVFENKPTFVFDITFLAVAAGVAVNFFSPAAASGFGIIITRNIGTFNFTTKYIGGSFEGNGGIARITAVNGTNTATVDIIVPFDSLPAGGIPGNECIIAEPSWSNTLGWPRKCSSFQNRALFANTDTLSNGLWGSVTNAFNDFDDLLTEDDSAITWLPTSDSINFINFIVPYRSLTIHTNSGIYSTPLSIETAITPTNFSLNLQDSHSANFIKPDSIDNQIITLSGNDAYSFVWDGINNAYTSTIVSIVNEQLIRTPVDQAAYADLVRAGSRYMFIVNNDGTMAVYQTLSGENVSGFTQAVLEQSLGLGFFRAVTSNFDGRAWFLTERDIAIAGTIRNVTANTADTLTNSGFTFPDDDLTAVMFDGVALPTSSPQLEADTFYFAVGQGGLIFKVFLTQADANNDENAVTFTDDGTVATVQPFPLERKLFIEELDFNAFVDCAGFVADPVGFDTVTTGTTFNAQQVLMQGDGFGFETTGVNNEINFEAHGNPVAVLDAQFGFPINVEITPMPLSVSMGGSAKSSNLLSPKHLRAASFLFIDTIGGTITQSGNTFPIALSTLEQIFPGDPPLPRSGQFDISVLNAWDDFRFDNFTINHREPFSITLTGIFYKLDA